MSTEETVVGPVDDKGRVDLSRSLRFKDKVDSEFTPPFIPDGWTTLHHGTNLARPEWKEKEHSLDEPIIEITSPLSCLTEDQIAKGGRSRVENTWTDDKSMPVELVILFPNFSSMRKGNMALVTERWSKNVGEDRSHEAISYIDHAYWDNYEARRDHPYIPKNSHLMKLDETNKEGKRIIYYIPEKLRDIYDTELADKSDKK